jgi:hypothetical protein
LPGAAATTGLSATGAGATTGLSATGARATFSGRLDRGSEPGHDERHQWRQKESAEGVFHGRSPISS